MEVRLDIWHFMRRFGARCTSEAHPLYASFLSHLSRVLFEWDPEDLDRLVAAKAAEFRLRGSGEMAHNDVVRSLTKQELARHCRRRTRGVEETTRLLNELVEVYESPRATDLLGVRLFPKGALRETWVQQERHVQCIQDPPGVRLYFSLPKPLMKGGHPLPVYKCARGSTSLEGFHNHLARFIPGIYTIFWKLMVG